MSGWLLAFLVVQWLIWCGLVAWVAEERGRFGFNWFILAVLLSPPVALIAVLVAKPYGTRWLPEARVFEPITSQPEASPPPREEPPPGYKPPPSSTRYR